MTQKINFRLRLVRKPRSPKGIYEQLDDIAVVPYDPNKFSSQKPAQRQVKIVTNQAGLDLFNQALQKEFKKQKHDRKRLSIKSKIFK
jgi:hypothetical protein